MMNIIVTAFNNSKVSDDAYHAGKNILKSLPDIIDEVKIKKVILPLVFNRCFDELEPHIDSNTKAIISFGSAGGDRFAIERVCLNRMHSNGPDNDGYQATDEIIKQDGQPAYFTNLNIRRIETSLNQHNIPAIISNSAGLALCNNIFYHTAYHADKHHLDYRFGFIHVPHMEHETNANKHTMKLSELITGASIIINDILR